LPVMVKMAENLPALVRAAISEALSGRPL